VAQLQFLTHFFALKTVKQARVKLANEWRSLVVQKTFLSLTMDSLDDQNSG